MPKQIEIMLRCTLYPILESLSPPQIFNIERSRNRYIRLRIVYLISLSNYMHATWLGRAMGKILERQLDRVTVA